MFHKVTENCWASCRKGSRINCVLDAQGYYNKPKPIIQSPGAGSYRHSVYFSWVLVSRCQQIEGYMKGGKHAAFGPVWLLLTTCLPPSSLPLTSWQPDSSTAGAKDAAMITTYCSFMLPCPAALPLWGPRYTTVTSWS